MSTFPVYRLPMGTIRAANKIGCLPELSEHFHLSTRDAVAEIIESETHSEETLDVFRRLIAAYATAFYHKPDEKETQMLVEARALLAKLEA